MRFRLQKDFGDTPWEHDYVHHLERFECLHYGLNCYKLEFSYLTLNFSIEHAELSCLVFSASTDEKEVIRVVFVMQIQDSETHRSVILPQPIITIFWDIWLNNDFFGCYLIQFNICTLTQRPLMFYACTFVIFRLLINIWNIILKLIWY